MKILIVEDEIALLESMSDYLERGDFMCDKATTLFEAEDKLISFGYDIILLDINLPDGNGIDLLNLVKKKYPNTGVLIVSARDSLEDKLKGLDLGADDYITKPFHLAELNSRINSLIRRKKFDGKKTIIFNEIEIDPNSRAVSINNSPITLTRKEYHLLLYFVTNTDKVITKESIAEHLWGDDMEMANNFDFIYTHMVNLRRKIKKGGGADYFQTMYGLGYKFTDNQ